MRKNSIFEERLKRVTVVEEHMMQKLQNTMQMQRKALHDLEFQLERNQLQKKDRVAKLMATGISTSDILMGGSSFYGTGTSSLKPLSPSPFSIHADLHTNNHSPSERSFHSKNKKSINPLQFNTLEGHQSTPENITEEAGTGPHDSKENDQDEQPSESGPP